MKEKHKDSKRKKEKKSKRHKERLKRSYSSSNSSESDEWVEHQKSSQNPPGTTREDWMSMTGIATYTKDTSRKEQREKEKKNIDDYNPATCPRELNPFWKDGGTGIPQIADDAKELTCMSQDGGSSQNCNLKRSSEFKRPTRGDDYYGSRKKSDALDRKSDNFTRPKSRDHGYGSSRTFKRPDGNDDYYKSDKRSRKSDDDYRLSSSSSSSSSWKKPSLEKRQNVDDEKSSHIQSKNEQSRSREMQERTKVNSEDRETGPSHNTGTQENFLSDEKMNKLAAKIVKAEIMGDTELVQKLKTKLENARAYRKEHPDAGKADEDEGVMLMATNSRGDSRPLTKTASAGDPHSKGGKRKVNTHTAGERMKYFSNDDAKSLSQMFEQEKYGSNYNEDAELARVASKHTNPNDDLEDIFTEEISKNVNTGKEDEKNRQRAIKDHQKLERTLEGCEYCIGSKTMMKHLMVSCGTKVYLAVPSRKSLTTGHCIITTVQHATSVTAVDEDVWEEIMNYRKALVNLFNSKNEDVVFFETATKLNKHPHLVVNCVPMPRDVGDTAPIYFKKALLECEAEWSMNKKVVDLKAKNIRKGVPKGLPYFWVDFGMDAGFAHVIEDQQLFPYNFAEEIIGGILDLDHQLWKRPQREHSDQLRAKVSEFAQLWKKYEIVSGNKT